MEIKKVAVLGAGIMGSGIVYHVAGKSDAQVVMTDVAQEMLDRAVAYHGKLLDKGIEKGKFDQAYADGVKARIHPTLALEDVADADIVVEAATENMAVKKEIFGKLDILCKDGAILASNTSALSITEIASMTKRPESVIGIHFFNPVPVMKLVELIRGYLTSDETFAASKGWCEALGKTVTGARDYPGFVTTRLGMILINEATFAYHEGVGTAEDIDTAMKLGYNHPMGPLALADLIGLDVVLSILDTLYTGFQDTKYRPCILLKKMVQAGRLGRKSGEGFYKY